MQLIPAVTTDIPALLTLINRAFRGDSARQGWTHESDLIDGDIRTDADTLIGIINNPDAVLLTYRSDLGEIQGCVNLELKSRGLYLGMLTVDPAIQGGGIGKILLGAADDVARQRGCHSIFMTVISARAELIAWYLRHGYVLTGETAPFLVDRKFAQPTQPLEFVILEKPV